MKALRTTSLVALLVLLTIPCLSLVFDSADQGLARGVDYGAKGKFKKAKVEFVNILKFVHSMEAAKRYLRVIEDLREQKIRKSTAIGFFKGTAYTFNNQWGEAIAEYDKAIALDPSYAEIYFNRGYTHNKMGEYDKGISDFTKVLEINPRYSMAYNNRGFAYGKKGQHDKAISDFTKAIELDPDNFLAYNNRGFTYTEKDIYNKAISDLTRAVKIHSNYAKAYRNRGTAYLLSGNNEMACSDFKRACELGKCRTYRLSKRKGFCE
jgi:tetratricopeptide (TPR) repeat protein